MISVFHVKEMKVCFVDITTHSRHDRVLFLLTSLVCKRKLKLSRIIFYAAVVVVLYLWRTGLRVAKHTYRYSSARVRQLKTSGRNLWHQKHLRGAVRASCRMWSYAKSAGCLNRMCSIGQWKRRLCRISGVNLAASTVNNLGCRHRFGKCDHRNSTLGKSMTGGDHFRRKLMSRKSMPCLNGALPHLKRSVSWGELVHLSDDRCSTVLKQYNHRVCIRRFICLSLSV